MGEGMKLGSQVVLTRRGLRLLFAAAFLLAGMVAAPMGARAVGDVVIGNPTDDTGGGTVGLSIGDTVYVASDSLNVRSGPGTGYSVIDIMVYGQNGLIIDGPVYADGYTWFQLTYVGGTTDGWVAGDYLGLVSTGGGLAVGDMVSVSSDELNVRSGPGLGYSVIDIMVYGQNGLIVDGPVDADGYTWYKLTYVGGAVDGWVAGDYLAYEGGSGFLPGDSVSVTAGALNVRSGAGTGYAIIDYLGYGDTATIIDGPYVADGYTWYQIEYSDPLYGWVAGEYLALS